MREELLHYYIENNEYSNILDLCKRYGDQENNLWIQAIKYFCKGDKKQTGKIQEILESISKIDALSPLLVLNILAKNQNIEFKSIKDYFLQKLREDRRAIEEDSKVVQENMKKAEEHRKEYKKLKTTAKQFQTTCSHCHETLENPSFHFLCGHSICNKCIKKEKVCLLCEIDHNNVLERKKHMEQMAKDDSKFSESLGHAKNKFDIVASYLGRGVFDPALIEEKTKGGDGK